MTTSIIHLYEILRKSVGEKAANDLSNFLDASLHQSRERNLETFASKEDLNNVKSELKQDITDLKSELKQDITHLRAELKDDISSLTIKMSETKSDIVRWLFAIMVSIVLTMIGLYFKK